MAPILEVRCRKVDIREKYYFSQQETVFRGTLDRISLDVLDWYKRNIRYYEKKDNFERETLPLVSFDLFLFFFFSIAIAATDIEPSEKDQKERKVYLEINDACVFLSGDVEFPELSMIPSNKNFQRIWNRIPHLDFDIKGFMNRPLPRKEIIIEKKSVYLNYSNRRKKKFLVLGNRKTTEKELLIREALEKNPHSTTSDLVQLTGIPPRTIRYYLKTMPDVKAEGANQSPKRSYEIDGTRQ